MRPVQEQNNAGRTSLKLGRMWSGNKSRRADPVAPVTAPDEALQLAHLAAIVESSDDAIVSKTLDGIILSWNSGATRIFGYQPEEAIGQAITILIPEELRDEERLILQRVRAGERIDHFDTVRVTKTGRRIPISLTVSPIRDAQGAIIGASKIARDISERARAERALRDSESRLSAEADALTRLTAASARLWQSETLEGGLNEMLTAVLELLGADKGHVQLLDRERQELVIVAQRGFEQGFLDRFRVVTAPDGSACGRALRNNARAIIDDVERDVAYIPFREIAREAGYRAVVSTPLIGSDGQPIGMITAQFRQPHRPTDPDLRRLDLYCRQASDFVQRCEFERILRDSESALRDADRRKDEFLALLAHELRNPLAPIRYALATTQKKSRTAAQKREAEEIIERQVAHMSRLLDDLLDISRITRGMLELKKSRTELTAVIGAAIEAARPILDAKQHVLALDLPKHAVRLEADPVRLAQVFSNLLINAAKYTDPNGQIQLSAQELDGEVVVAIRDNGIGMEPAMIPRLFGLFSQAHTALERSEGGLGVGLALVRGLVELHGGSVEARSDGPGRGSEFSLRLPIGSAAPRQVEVASAPASPVAGTRLRILVVDDNRDAADTCTTLLEFSGHQVQAAYNGEGALEAAARLQPQVALLDIGLPDITGYDLARRIRSEPWGHDVTLIAMTGWGQDDDRRRAFEAGFDQHLTKPVAADALESLVAQLAQARSTSIRPG